MTLSNSFSAQNSQKNIFDQFRQILKQLWPKNENSSKTETLRLLTLVSVLVILCIKYLFGKQKGANQTSVPRIRWTGFNLGWLDGFITLVKLRKEGVKCLEYVPKEYGPVFKFPAGMSQLIALAHPNQIQKLLSSTNPGHLNKSSYFYDIILSKLLKNGIFQADVKVWAPHRKTISKALTYNSFPAYLKFINDGAKQMAKTGCLEATNGTLDNPHMKELLENSIIKVVTKIIMGSETFNIADEERDEFHESFRKGKDIVMYRLLHPYLLIKPIWLLHNKKRELDRYINIVNKFSHKMTDCYRAKEYVKAWEFKEDFNLKLDAQTDSDYFEMEDELERKKTVETMGIKPFECMIEHMIKSGMNNEEIATEVSTFLIGGHETVVAAMDMLLFHLASHPEYQQKCREEFDELLESKKFQKNENLTIESLSQLKFLERCILESLRITPTIPAFIRHLDLPLELDKDCVLEGGQAVFVVIWSVHRNPEIYPNPTVFDPDRFLPENVKKRHSHSFIPFSMGTRNCIGWKIALLYMKVYTPWILRHFELTTTDKLEDVKLLFDITLKCERPYNITFTKRKL